MKYKGGKKECQTDLKGWNTDRTEFLMSQNFRYTHRTVQTLITSGQKSQIKTFESNPH